MGAVVRFSQFVGHLTVAGDLCTIHFLPASFWDRIFISTSITDDLVAEWVMCLMHPATLLAII